MIDPAQVRLMREKADELARNGNQYPGTDAYLGEVLTLLRLAGPEVKIERGEGLEWDWRVAIGPNVAASTASSPCFHTAIGQATLGWLHGQYGGPEEGSGS